MVDPDNRRPVDYKRRQLLLESVTAKSPRELLETWQTGAIKMKVIRDTLQFRSKHPDLFMTGEYVPIKVEGKYQEHSFAFERKLGSVEIVVTVPRLTAPLGFPPIGAIWKNTRLHLQPSKFRHVFTGKILSGSLDLAAIFAEFPVALLVKED
jgi:(1->4)-alpha-D-glucan 1-alpha-D-glucosylmutase